MKTIHREIQVAFCFITVNSGEGAEMELVLTALWNTVGIDLRQLQYKVQNPQPHSEDVKTELVLTPLRAFWLWNAAGIDLSLLLRNNLKYKPLSNC